MGVHGSFLRQSLLGWNCLAVVVLLSVARTSVAFQQASGFSARRTEPSFLPTRTTTTSLSTTSGTIAASSADLFEDGQSEVLAMSSKAIRVAPRPAEMTGLRAAMVRVGMISFIASMCVALPATLVPQKLLYKLRIVNRTQKERLALWTGQICARYLLKVFPFVHIETFPYQNPNPPASIWVCNHASMIDVFLLMAADKKLRGPKRRPIKVVYWKGLEANPVSRLLFRQAGFIPVQMAANKPGEENSYDRSSFKQLLKDSKQAFEDGFDVGILPEGQLNPHPEEGLLPTFSGAFTLARMSRRPIQMMALYGTHHLWHPDDAIGMAATGRRVRIRAYPTAWQFDNATDFLACFEAVVGEFATRGVDLPPDDLSKWLSSETGAAGAKEGDK